MRDLAVPGEGAAEQRARQRLQARGPLRVRTEALAFDLALECDAPDELFAELTHVDVARLDGKLPGLLADPRQRPAALHATAQRVRVQSIDHEPLAIDRSGG